MLALETEQDLEIGEKSSWPIMTLYEYFDVDGKIIQINLTRSSTGNKEEIH